MFQKIAKHRANDASNDVHRPPLLSGDYLYPDIEYQLAQGSSVVHQCILSRHNHPAGQA